MEKSTKAKINMAFRRLRKAGYFAEQNFWCCQSCGWADIMEEGASDKAVFYHRQDAQSIKGSALVDNLFLAWSGDGAEIVKILADCGLDVLWNGEPNTRIMICKDRE